MQLTAASATLLYPEDVAINLLDNTGKILFSQKQNTSSPSQIDLSNYASGVYYIKVAIGKEQLVL